MRRQTRNKPSTTNFRNRRWGPKKYRGRPINYDYPEIEHCIKDAKRKRNKWETKRKQLRKKQIKIPASANLILAKQNQFTKFQGSALFRWRILLATLTHKSICIDNIRANDPKKPGLRDYEMSFLKILDKVTNGSVFEINETGTKLRYRPGTLLGAQSPIYFKCPTTRGIPYWLEPMVVLLLFCKERQSTITFYGATYHELDCSVDQIRSVLFSILRKRFNVQDIKIDLKNRALSPSGGGKVRLTVPSIQTLKTIDLTDPGMIKRIRGLCYTISMAPTLANRVRGTCNEILTDYIPDVWIFNDATSREDLLKAIDKINNTTNAKKASAGYGLTLIAETTNEVVLSVHQLYQLKKDRKTDQLPMTAEEFGKKMARMMLEEISYGGTVDTSVQPMVLLLMALCTEDVSRVRLGRISKQSVNLLRLIKELLAVTFKVKQDPETGTIFASCMGMGYSNIWKQAT